MIIKRILKEIAGFLVFIIFWCASGMTADQYSMINHPGFWMAYGFIVGSVGMSLYCLITGTKR